MNSNELIMRKLISIAEINNQCLNSMLKTRLAENISEKQKAGWNTEEIVSYMKNVEDINPFLDEEVALSRMRIVWDRAVSRIRSEN